MAQVRQAFMVGGQGQKGGVSLGIQGATSTPRSRAEGKDTWSVAWGCTQKVDRAVITVRFRDGSHTLIEAAYVPGDPNVAASLHNPIFLAPLGAVVAITFVLSRGKKEWTVEFNPKDIRPFDAP